MFFLTIAHRQEVIKAMLEIQAPQAGQEVETDPEKLQESYLNYPTMI
jgi:hypothetical protein